MHFFCKKHPFYFAGSENLCTFVVNLVMSISNGATVVDRTYQDNNNLLKFNSMIKLISKQQPMIKIGTKEKELKYVLNLVLSGSISEKEVIEFACKHTGMQPTMVKAAIESCLQIVELYIALGYSVICYPHHQNFRCLTCKTPLLDSIPPQSHWGSPPNPLGRLPINDVRLWR